MLLFCRQQLKKTSRLSSTLPKLIAIWHAFCGWRCKSYSGLSAAVLWSWDRQEQKGVVWRSLWTDGQTKGLNYNWWDWVAINQLAQRIERPDDCISLLIDAMIKKKTVILWWLRTPKSVANLFFLQIELFGATVHCFGLLGSGSTLTSFLLASISMSQLIKKFTTSFFGEKAVVKQFYQTNRWGSYVPCTLENTHQLILFS